MEDTIAAISTPPGEGGIGIVRVSGDLAVKIASKIFRGPGGKKVKIVPRKVHYGEIVDPRTKKLVDEVLLTYMKAPRSYTTQDVIEINCHGGPMVLKTVLDLTLSLGARVAEPGEFTKRAFFGGRIDLAQAESVMDVIRAKTDQARQVALNQLRGKLSGEIDRVRDEIIDFMLQLEVRIDFCEDDVPPLEENYKRERIEGILADIEKILENFKKGKIYREGIRACIIGPPNVGKSTLLNTLLGEERAIVTPEPGTTRDRIEETVNLGGVPLVLIDTAGIRKSSQMVESIGIQKSIEAARDSQLVFLILDASREEIPDRAEVMGSLVPEKTLVIMNKIDLGTRYSREFIHGFFPENRIIEVSLKEKVNLEKIEKAALDMIFGGKSGSPAEVILSNARHRQALVKTKQYLNKAKNSIENNMADDFITIDLKYAIDTLGEITGKVVYEDLLDRVFENFCIGK